MALPPALLNAVSDLDGGHLVLVIGAGTSHEEPTRIPLSSEFSQTVHEKLLEDGILESPCEDPTNLSSVADATFDQHNSVQELVARVKQMLIVPAPNEGHNLAAAMMREGAITNIITLNYDLAMQIALGSISQGNKVRIISSPSDHAHMGASNLIYLHGNATSPPDLWIIRTHDLEEAWKNGWQEVITRAVLAYPVVAFVGLGTPTPVLLETSKRISDALDLDQQQVFFVGPGEPSESEFFNELGLPLDSALSYSWVDFMVQLSTRLVAEHRNDIQARCARLVEQQGIVEEDVKPVCDTLGSMGLLGMGAVRAKWLLSGARYVAYSSIQPNWIAHCLLIIAYIERVGECTAYIHQDGIVEFRDHNGVLANILLAHGRGEDTAATVQDKVQRARKDWNMVRPKPRCVLIIGLSGPMGHQVAPPEDILAEKDEDSIVTAPEKMEFIEADDLRANQDLLKDVLAQ